MADGREIHQNNAAVSLLQSDGGIHCGSSGADSTLGVQKSEDACLAGTALRPTEGRSKTGEGFDHRLAVGSTVQKLACARSHSGDDVGGLCPFAHCADL